MIDFNPIDAEILHVVRDLIGLSADLLEPPTLGKPYVVITPGTVGQDETALLLDDYRDCEYLFEMVGEGPEQVRWLQKRIHEELLDAGRWSSAAGICGMLLLSTQPMRRDDATTWVLMETIQVKAG